MLALLWEWVKGADIKGITELPDRSFMAFCCNKSKISLYSFFFGGGDAFLVLKCLGGFHLPPVTFSILKV